MSWIKLIVRILIAGFFILSALGKLMSIEAFEVYVYRSSFLGFDAAATFSRLLAGLELLLGICLLIKLKFRLIWWAGLLSLLLFSGFLLMEWFGGSEENCFCLGELMELTPAESLLKNFVLILFLLFIKNTKAITFNYSKAAFTSLLVVLLALPFVLNPPDFMVQGRFSVAGHNPEAFEAAISSGLLPAEFVKGKKLISFYSTGCKFCKMASGRIATIARKANLDSSQVKIAFWGDKNLDPSPFFEETHSPAFAFSTMETKEFLAITKGELPLILLVENGKVMKEMNYRTIDEGEIEEFFGGGITSNFVL